MCNLDQLQAMTRAKNALLRQLSGASRSDWGDLVVHFLDGLGAFEPDPAITLLLVFDIAEWVMQSSGRESMCAFNFRERLAQDDAFFERDVHRMRRELAGDLKAWICSNAADPHIARVSRFIDQHLGEHVTVQQIAAVCGYSAKRLTQIHKQRTGMTVHEYLVKRRMEQAKSLMELGEKTEAAMLLVGYTNKTHFNLTFERHMGCKPGTFRRNAGGAHNPPLHAPLSRGASVAIA
jgi:AraC-like DNA-binding protein